MSLRIVPAVSHPSSTSNLSSTLKSSTSHPSAPSAPGLPDALRASFFTTGPSSVPFDISATLAPHHTSVEPTSTHPLEARLARWRTTQHDLKMTGIRRTFGLHEALRREVEIKVAREGEYRPLALGGSAGVQGDVLEGRDTVVEWEDVFGADSTREGVDFHTEMEARLKMDR